MRRMKICSNCGAELTDFAAFCDACGMRQPSAQMVTTPYAYRPTYQTSQIESIDPLRLGVVLLIIGFLAGSGVGVAMFSALAGSGSQTTVTQRVIVTSMMTPPPVTQTQFFTVTQTIPQTTITTSMTTSLATAGWREIKRFTGSADMTTEPFDIQATAWRVRWSYSSPQATSFSFVVYQVGQSAYVQAVSSYATGASSVTNINKGQASFYLSIITRGNYEIIVEVPS
jgi:hypothetical protein